MEEEEKGEENRKEEGEGTKKERERKIMPQTESKKQTPLTTIWIPDIPTHERTVEPQQTINRRRRSRVEAEEA